MKILKTHNIILISTLVLSLLNVACEKETEYELLSGQLVGHVSLRDNSRINLLDNSDVEVIVEGTDPQITVTTDENGQYIIDDLETGTYNLIFNKEGYSPYTILGYQFLGGNVTSGVNPVTLYGLSRIQINDLTLSDYYSYFSVQLLMSANVYDPDENDYSFCRYYLSNEPDVSYKNYISTDFTSCYNGDEGINRSFAVDTLQYPVGSELYLIAYPATESYQYYTDINTGKKIYTSINVNKPSEIVSITIPEVEQSWW